MRVYMTLLECMVQERGEAHPIYLPEFSMLTCCLPYMLVSLVIQLVALHNFVKSRKLQGVQYFV